MLSILELILVYLLDGISILVILFGTGGTLTVPKKVLIILLLLVTIIIFTVIGATQTTNIVVPTYP